MPRRCRSKTATQSMGRRRRTRARLAVVDAGREPGATGRCRSDKDGVGDGVAGAAVDGDGGPRAGLPMAPPARRVGEEGGRDTGNPFPGTARPESTHGGDDLGRCCRRRRRVADSTLGKMTMARLAWRLPEQSELMGAQLEPSRFHSRRVGGPTVTTATAPPPPRTGHGDNFLGSESCREERGREQKERRGEWRRVEGRRRED